MYLFYKFWYWFQFWNQADSIWRWLNHAHQLFVNLLQITSPKMGINKVCLFNSEQIILLFLFFTKQISVFIWFYFRFMLELIIVSFIGGFRWFIGFFFAGTWIWLWIKENDCFTIMWRRDMYLYCFMFLGTIHDLQASLFTIHTCLPLKIFIHIVWLYVLGAIHDLKQLQIIIHIVWYYVFRCNTRFAGIIIYNFCTFTITNLHSY